jgi:hypothetical protein
VEIEEAQRVARAFYEALDRGVLALYREGRRPWRPRDYVYDSEIGGCPRRTVLSMTREPPPNPEESARSVLAPLLGSLINDFVQDALRAGGALIKAEDPINDDRTHGRADAWITLDGAGDHLLEIKTISLWGYNHLDRPKDEHVSQVTRYMEKTGFPHALFAYWAPEDLDILDPKVFIEADRPEEREKARAWIDNVLDHHRRGQVPPIPEGYEANGWPCRKIRRKDGAIFSCPFRDECWPGVPRPTYEELYGDA